MPRSPKSAPPPAPHALPEALTAHTFRAWAKDRHLEAFLDVPLERLARYVAEAHIQHELRWRHDVNAHTALTLRHAPAVSEPARRAIRVALERIAAQVANAVAEEAETPRTGPGDALLTEVWDRWTTLRAHLRTTAHPVRRALRAKYALQVSADGSAVTVSPSPAVGCARAEIALTVPVGPASTLALPCRCPHAGPSCAARVGAVDALLDQLEDPSSTVARAIAASIETPWWRRALDRLDSVAPPAKPPADARLAWRLVGEASTLRAEAVFAERTRTTNAWRISNAGLDAMRRSEDPRDVAVAAAMTEAQSYYGSQRQRDEDRVTALRGLVGHPRVFHRGEPVLVREATASVVVRPTVDDGAQVQIDTGDGRRSPVEAAALLRAGTVADTLFRLQTNPASVILLAVPPHLQRVIGLLAEVPDTYPPASVDALLDTLQRWQHHVGVQLEGALAGDEVPPSARLEARLSVPARGVLRAALRVRPLPGGAAVVPGTGDPIATDKDGERRVWARRDLDAERQVHARVWAGLDGTPSPDVELTDPQRALAWLEQLRDHPDVDVTWDGTARWRTTAPVDTTALALSSRSARAWFAVDGVATVDDHAVPLSALLAAVRDRQTYVQVSEDRWARLTDRLRDDLSAIARGRTGDDGGELLALELPLFDALVQGGARVDEAPHLRAQLDRLRALGTDEPTVPDTLHASLRPYQVDGYRFLARLAQWAPGAVLADDMGLGKTLQALALLLSRASLGPTLVVAPTSVGFNWVQEAARFAPSLRVQSWRGADRKAALKKLRPGDVLVTSYELVQRNAAELAGVSFATLVLDEAQAVKNWTTKRWEAVAGLDRVFTLALTGTPLENRLEELWALTALTTPGLFGKVRPFRTTWAVPIERERRDDVRAALTRRLRPFLLRRTKAVVATELPERTVVDVVVPLSREEHQLYEDVRRGALVELDRHGGAPAAQTRIRVLAALTALRQVACHPSLHDPTWPGATSKLDRVRELVAELRAEGHRALLFSQFVGHLTLVRAALEEDGVRMRYLDGSTPEAQRRAEVEAFQAGEADVFLISLKAGGSGLNLTAATYVIHLDPWWNPAVEDQATDRAHRIGQTRAVTVYRMVAEGTVEQQILAMHTEKRQLVAGVLEGTDAGPAVASVDQLLQLLRDGPG